MILLKVGALLSAIAWAVRGHSLASIAAVMLLLAASLTALGGRRRASRSPGPVAVSVFVLGLVVIIERAWVFAPAVLVVWGAIAAVPVLVWLCTRQAASRRPGAATQRQAVMPWLRARHAEPAGGRILPTER